MEHSYTCCVNWHVSHPPRRGEVGIKYTGRDGASSDAHQLCTMVIDSFILIKKKKKDNHYQQHIDFFFFFNGHMLFTHF